MTTALAIALSLLAATVKQPLPIGPLRAFLYLDMDGDLDVNGGTNGLPGWLYNGVHYDVVVMPKDLDQDGEYEAWMWTIDRHRNLVTRHWPASTKFVRYKYWAYFPCYEGTRYALLLYAGPQYSFVGMATGETRARIRQLQWFQFGMRGPGKRPWRGCERHDLDGDGDVDLKDWSYLQARVLPDTDGDGIAD